MDDVVSCGGGDRLRTDWRPSQRLVRTAGNLTNLGHRGGPKYARTIRYRYGTDGARDRDVSGSDDPSVRGKSEQLIERRRDGKTKKK